MCITNVTDYDKMTDDYNKILAIKNDYTLNENNIDKIIPSLLRTIPCGLSFLCLMSLMVYTIMKLVFQ